MFRRELTTHRNTAIGAFRLQPGSFQRPGSYTVPRSNSRERRVTVTFAAANAPTAIYHGLGFPPSGYEVLAKQTAAALVYNDYPLPSTSRVIVLKCNTANAVFDILVR